VEAALRDINAQQEEQRVLREVERKIVEAGYRAMFSAPIGGLTPPMQQNEGETSDDEAHDRHT
jgi:hypothetical protein